MIKFLLVGSLILLTSCGFDKQAAKDALKDSEDSVQQPKYTKENLLLSVRSASLLLMGRLPTQQEYDEGSSSDRGYEKVIRGYLDSTQFLDKMREYFYDSFELSGNLTVNNQTVDGNEPTNLILYIIKNNLPYSEALTANYCVDINLNKKASCSTFGNQPANVVNANSAGVLTTRAWILKHKNHYNFRIVSKNHQHFSCGEYPDLDDPGMKPTTEISGTHKQFDQTSGGPDQACWRCHNTLNPRAVMYYNFDLNALFTTNRNTSTRRDDETNSNPNDLLAPNVTPRYFNEQTATSEPMMTMKDYGSMVTKSMQFKRCAVQRFYNYIFNEELLTPLPSEMNYLVLKASEDGFKVKDIFWQILSSGAFVNH